MNAYDTNLTNCPNCGAPINGYKCGYCGTIFSSPLDSFTGQRALLMRITDDNQLFISGIDVTCVENNPLFSTYYNCDSPVMVMPQQETTITAHSANNAEEIGELVRKVQKILVDK